MARSRSAWPNPLDDPLAMTAAGLLLVVLARATGLGLPLALLSAALAAPALTMLRLQRRSRSERRRDRRISESVDGARQRAGQLAAQAELVRAEAMERFQDPDHLEPLSLVQLCCERLSALPERIEERRPLLESTGEAILSADDLQTRLSRETQQLRREASPTLNRERQRLVQQMSRNLAVARHGIDRREARLLALATRLEQIEGGLIHLHLQVEHQWPSTEASGGAITAAVSPLDEALDQIDRLLDAGEEGLS